MFRTVLAGSVVSMVFLAGCYPDQPREAFRRQNEMSTAALRQYALSALQYASLGQNAVYSSDEWQEGTLASGRLADIGVDVPDSFSEDLFDSGYCKDESDPSNVLEYVFTWFTQDMSVSGLQVHTLGTDQEGKLVKEMEALSPGGQFGIMEDSGIVRMSGFHGGTGTGDFSMPSGCSLPILPGSPVILQETAGKVIHTPYALSSERFSVDDGSGSIEVIRNHRVYIPDGATISEIEEIYDFTP